MMMQRSWTHGRALFLVVLVALGIGTMGCKKLAQNLGKKAAEEVAAQGEGPKPPRGAAAPGPGSAASVNYFADASTLPGVYKSKIGGPTRVLELLIYPTYGYAQIQDPKKPENVDQYDMRDGAIEGTRPVKFTGKPPSAAEIKEVSFDIGEVDFGAVPKMAKDALVQTKIDDGKVTHMILKRPLPFNKDVRFRVYVNGARRSGSVEYDAKGNMKKVY